MSLNLKLILNILGLVSLLIGGTMLIGLVVALAFGEARMAAVFLGTMAVLGGAGFALFVLTRQGRQTLKIREAVLAVALCWVFAAALCAIPYLLSGAHRTFIDAFFESMACLTTTGATLFENVSDLPGSLLFWRQFSSWLGGMGILVFAISIMPMLGYGAASLANAEAVAQNIEKVRARMTDTAKSIYILYSALTAIEIALLACGGMGLFESFLVTFGCMGNGGFANYDFMSLIGGNTYFGIVVVVFCLLASLNFVHVRNVIVRRRFGEVLRDPETRLFLGLGVFFVASVFAVLLASGTYGSGGEALWQGIFQSVSFLTTAGYAGADFDKWPMLTHWILFIAMVIGGCSGSTSGGIKVVRVAVLASLVRRNIYKKIHPNAVVAVKVGDKAVPNDRVSSIATFVVLYIVITLVSCILLSLENFDMETTFGSVIAMLSNTGLVFGQGVGYMDSFHVFAPASRLLLAILMLIGRLEIFTVILLFFPAFWRPYK